MKIAIITAGGAGMFCGSCMQDNTLARALLSAGHDVTLVPTYTPIRVDEDNVSQERVFLGGVNVYLDSQLPGWSRLPRFLKAWLDRPAVLRLLTRRSSSTDASQLGPLTLDMLKGADGPQRSEIDLLVNWLVQDLQPEMILFSNALLSGIVPTLRRHFGGRIACLLQGDDIFLNALPDRWRQDCLTRLNDNSRHFDAFLSHSQWYANLLGEMMELDADRFHTIPLSLDCRMVPDVRSSSSEPAVVGYFARICPEKGADSFLKAAARLLPQHDSLQFHLAGYLPDLHRRRFLNQLQSLQRQFGPERLCYRGSPDSRQEKFSVLQSYRVLCAPGTYPEPKGIFVLEAALAGVPAVLPHQGAFPERLETLQHGWTWDPTSEQDLDRIILQAITEANDPRLSTQLQQAVRDSHSTDVTGPQLTAILQQI